jgi:hypothetical protein
MPTGIPGSRSIPKCHPRLPYQAKGLCKRCYQKKYRPAHLVKRDRRGERFGLTPKQYAEKREKQRKDGDLCGLCKRPLGKERAHLDHDHRTNKLRDFIHRDCNLAIGLLEDDPNLCRLAAEYLEKHGEQHVRI